MNLRELEYILALADTRHFGRAAARCFVSQPTLSMQIAKLEQELGVTLFERNRRRVDLTPIGKRIVDEARHVIDGVKLIQHIAHGESKGFEGPFYLGVIPTIGPYLLPHILPELKKRYPQVALYLREEITDRLVEGLHSSDLDAALMSLPLDDPTLDHVLLCEEEFVAALPADHPLAKRKRLSPADLHGETILLLEEGNCMRDQTLKLCRGSRKANREEFRATSIESLRQMVVSGIGCTILPKLSTTGPFAQEAQLAIRPFAAPAPTRAIVLAYRRTYPKAVAIRALGQALAKRLTARK